MRSIDSANTPCTPRYVAAGLLVLTLLVRGGVLLLAPGALASDPDGYRQLAENLLEYGSFGHQHRPTAYRPPLYPLLLGACVALGNYSRVAIALLHLLLGIATVWMTFRLAREWGLGRYAPVAAALVACDPILLGQSIQVMTETTATLLATVVLACLTWTAHRPSIPRAIAVGVGLGLAVLCRPVFLVWALAVALLLPALPGTWSGRLKVFGSLAAAMLVVLAPWAVRNYLQFGRPIITTTHGGYTLLLGNNPQFYEYLRWGQWGSIWDADKLHRARRYQVPVETPADELRADRLAYTEARENIARQPAMFLYGCLVRAGRLWAPLPHQVAAEEGPVRRGLRYGVGLWYLGELVLAAIGLAALWRRDGGGRNWRTPWLWGMLLAGTFTAVHTVYWSNMRMRAPLMPVVAIMAVAGVIWLREDGGFGGGRAVYPNSLPKNNLRH